MVVLSFETKLGWKMWTSRVITMLEKGTELYIDFLEGAIITTNTGGVWRIDGVCHAGTTLENGWPNGGLGITEWEVAI